nr:EOG090X05JJ [Ceriodaphnia reticulata]
MRSITQAVHEKYCDDDEDSSGSGFILFVPRSSPRKCLPSTLILDHCEIDSVGDETSLSSMCHEVNELDLAHNQISQWDEVNKLITCLPKLSFLNLSYNMLGSVNVNTPETSYPSLKKLVLNRVGIQWNALVPYLSLIPNLEELHLSFNQIEISTEEKSNKKDEVFSKIKTLHFDGNRVENRDHLQWLSYKFPSLNSLVLCDCPVWTLRWKSPAAREAQSKSMSGSSSGSCSGSAESSTTASCSGDGKTSFCCVPLFEQDRTEHTKTSMTESDLFPHLRSISLNNSMFDCWEEISQLRIWPSLTELRMQTCPLFRKLTEHERRELTIARLPNLRRLNGGGDISAKEREEAERNFIRRFHDYEVKPARYHELCDVHGHVSPFAEVSLCPPKVANVWVRYGEQRWNEQSLSLYMTMKELREKFSFTVGLPASKLRLWHYDHCQPMLMRFPTKRLYSYNIKDGDEFMIDEKLG